MKRMKRMIFLGLAALLLFCLTGCVTWGVYYHSDYPYYRYPGYYHDDHRWDRGYDHRNHRPGHFPRPHRR